MSYRRKHDPQAGLNAILTARRSPRRMVLRDGGWYFDTRERVSIGPYVSRTEALVASDRLTELIRNAHPARARAVIRDFLRAKRVSVVPR